MPQPLGDGVLQLSGEAGMLQLEPSQVRREDESDITISDMIVSDPMI